MISLRTALRLLREPVPVEKKRLLAERWEALAAGLRRPGQGLGRQATGCGATIGAMPRCDFDCRGCYLGDDANSVPRLPLAEVLAQVDALRRHLGPKGNLQITDGEVTLLPEADLVALVRHARAVGLIPMLMTHGDGFRRRPELLGRLVRDGGLTEVSIHVDALQRGRRGEFREARTEAELMPLRDELAGMIRAVRRDTGIRLRAATTLTVSRDNLDEIDAVIRWAFANRDVFGLVSLQPLARVGRTRSDQVGVAAGEVWEQVAQALEPFGFDGLRRTPLQLGHPDCTRMEPLVVVEGEGRPPRVLPIVRPGETGDRELVEEFFDRGLGGVNFRDDSPAERLCRGAGLFLRAPGWFLGPVRRWCAARLAELGTTLPGLTWAMVRGRARVDSFTVVSHHFMDPTELRSERGRERLAACVFRVPVDGEMVPMCRVNAGGVRDRVYAASRRRAERPQPRAVAGAGAG